MNRYTLYNKTNLQFLNHHVGLSNLCNPVTDQCLSNVSVDHLALSQVRNLKCDIGLWSVTPSNFGWIYILRSLLNVLKKVHKSQKYIFTCSCKQTMNVLSISINIHLIRTSFLSSESVISKKKNFSKSQVSCFFLFTVESRWWTVNTCLCNCGSQCCRRTWSPTPRREVKRRRWQSQLRGMGCYQEIQRIWDSSCQLERGTKTVQYVHVIF